MTTAALALVLAWLTLVYGAKEKPELSDEIKEIIQHVHRECVSKTGVAEDFLNYDTSSLHCISLSGLLVNEDIANCENGIFKEDKKLKCYMFCLMEEGSLVDDDDNIDYDMLISLIPERYTDRVSKMMLPCKHLDTPEKDKCQKVFDMHKCSYEKDPDFYFLF